MAHLFLSPFLTFVACTAAALAQQSEAVRKAFVDADAPRSVITAAAEQVLAADAVGRARFVATLRAIAAAAPKAEAAPPAKEPVPAGKDASPPAKAPEFADAVREAMAAAIADDGEAAKAALARLAPEPAALQRLDERGKAILSRCLVLTVRKKAETNAVFAGQYAEIADFGPEAADLLLKWTVTPPRDVARADEFRVACLRAVRDVLPVERATDATRATLREIAGKAQSSGNQNLFITAACAMHQFGDPVLFDGVKERLEKGASSETATERYMATNTLADLHYQLRNYEEAVKWFKAAVEVGESVPEAQQGQATTIYNTACSLVLSKRNDEALQYLEKALQTGAKTRPLGKAMIDADHDMNGLRGDPRFAELMERYFGKPSAPK